MLVEHFSQAPGITSCVRAVAKLAHLVDEWWRDLDVLQSTKDDLLEDLMTGTIQSTPAEQLTIRARIRAEALQEGQQKGHREGLQKGHQEGHREALLRVARFRLDDAAVTELEAIEDLATLEARLLELL